MEDKLLAALRTQTPTFWRNPALAPFAEAVRDSAFTAADVEDAARRLGRFAPVIRHYFPETEAAGGIIESPLTEIPRMRRLLTESGAPLRGRLFLKRDDSLAVAGSVKARGGIYEVLRHAETLALSAGLLAGYDDDYEKLTTPAARALFAKHKIQVGSTGNLGMSIGIMSAAMGFEAIVHMSADAKQWKKDLLRSRGATVLEYDGDYGAAVENGRRRSEADPASYFVDDERSRDLFLGYAVAGARLQKQLAAAGVTVDAGHPLYVYIPCGVGGAPGGVTYGLKLLFGDHVHCFFAEPTAMPCMLLGLATGKMEGISVTEIGLGGKTQADGLAVGRPSPLVSREMRRVLSGAATVPDRDLFLRLRQLYETEGIFIEPSACAAFGALTALHGTEAGRGYLFAHPAGDGAAHILWATGGGMVPPETRRDMLAEGKDL